MTGWSADQLTRIGEADELQIASRDKDGSLGRAKPIWVVAHDGELYVRAVNGPSGAWFRRTRIARSGHIQAGGIDADVTFEDADHDLDDELDVAYRAKYQRYPASYSDSVTTSKARATTTKLVRA